MPNPKNGRTTSKKKTTVQPQVVQEQGIPFDSDLLVSDEVIQRTRQEAEMAQLRATNAGLTAQLLETRNELIRAKQALDAVAEANNGKKKSKSSDDNEAGAVRQAGGRGKAGKSKKG